MRGEKSRSAISTFAPPCLSMKPTLAASRPCGPRSACYFFFSSFFASAFGAAAGLFLGSSAGFT